MQLSGDVLIGAARTRVWDALNDPVVLAACIPGCEGVEVVSPTEKTARVMVKVGPVRARFGGRILLADATEGERCSMSFEGSGGAAGMARGQSQVELTDEDGGTRLRYTVQASVAGKLGQVGGRMIDAAAKQMADQFFNAFQTQVAPPVAAGAATTAEAQHGGAAGDADAGATGAARASATAAVAVSSPATTPAVRAAATPAASAALASTPSAASTEWLRVKWFVLGSLATGFGIWIGSKL